MVDSVTLLQWSSFVGVMQAAVLLAGLALAFRALLGGWGVRHRLDAVYLATLLPFSGLAGLHLMTAWGWLGEEPLVITTRVMYQLMIISITVFITVLVRGGGLLHRLLIGIQAVVGLGLAAWPASAWPWPGVPAWEWFNAGFTTLLLVLMAHALWRNGATRGWTILLAAIAALGVMSSDMSAAHGGAVAVSWPQVLYTAILLVLWLLATRRVRSAGHEAMPASSPVREEVRRQLAQELHDGVGSHLTSIISALDAGSPDQRSTAARLRECQVELKLLVDGVDEEASVLSLLASLRYRMQPLLREAGVDLRWLIADEEVLDGVQGAPAREILRIAQEALANAVRHSGASIVKVICCYSRRDDALRLDISDNGVGFQSSQLAVGAGDAPPLGKGLGGMHERARKLGGQLSIEGPPGTGTHVLLRVPMDRLYRSPSL